MGRTSEGSLLRECTQFLSSLQEKTKNQREPKADYGFGI